ncbi:hypothetical protein [Nocardia sp. CNY236]|uniref:hypothetical protein n=1 Tax=Nocardia sp. CNY236 TaxID=1169152 RepID=UPI000415FE68|nr:hypothetical protein [Nocardia sp. CNY236]
MFGSATDPDGPVFANRDGGWMRLANLRRSLRAALPDELRWVTPYSFRRTVETVVRDDLGPAQAQAQLSHSKLSTTEQHYFQRQTQGPDAGARSTGTRAESKGSYVWAKYGISPSRR